MFEFKYSPLYAFLYFRIYWKAQQFHYRGFILWCSQLSDKEKAQQLTSSASAAYELALWFCGFTWLSAAMSGVIVLIQS